MRKRYLWRTISIVFAMVAAVGTTGAAVYQKEEDLFVATFLGDSITYGAHCEESYADELAEMLGVDAYYNYGICKTEISTSGTQPDSMVERYQNISKESDLIFVLGGTNDWGHNAVLGSFGDTDSATFYGALENLMNGLTEDYPDAKIVFATPLKRISTGSVDCKNENGDTLEQFANAIIEVGNAHQLPVIDLYHASECDFTSDISYEVYWSDGLHPNETGHHILANYIEKQLQLYL